MGKEREAHSAMINLSSGLSQPAEKNQGASLAAQLHKAVLAK